MQAKDKHICLNLINIRLFAIAVQRYEKKPDIIFETNNITTNKVIYKLHQMLVKIKFANFTA